MHIAVLMGGDSPERDISLLSGRAVAAALRQAGHDATEVEIPNVAAVISLPIVREADLVFPALHGGQGEDGHLQALLDVMGVRYALSGAAASALAMDKGLSKRLMRGAGIPTPDWLQVTWDCQSDRPGAVAGPGHGDRGPALTLAHIENRVAAELDFPVVIKLNGAGSSVGVELVEVQREFAAVFERVAAVARCRVPDILVEKYVPGRELTAAILRGRRLPLLEIRPRKGFYDYANKYTDGASEYLVPAPVHSPVYEQISSDALRLYEMAGCRGLARVDFRLDGDDHHCLEINTIPGMTENSLAPKSAAAVGIGFADLLDDVCRAALEAD